MLILSEIENVYKEIGNIYKDDSSSAVVEDRGAENSQRSKIASILDKRSQLSKEVEFNRNSIIAAIITIFLKVIIILLVQWLTTTEVFLRVL